MTGVGTARSAAKSPHSACWSYWAHTKFSELSPNIHVQYNLVPRPQAPGSSLGTRLCAVYIVIYLIYINMQPESELMLFAAEEVCYIIILKEPPHHCSLSIEAILFFLQPGVRRDHMRDQAVKVEEILQTFSQICMSAITSNTNVSFLSSPNMQD